MVLGRRGGTTGRNELGKGTGGCAGLRRWARNSVGPQLRLKKTTGGWDVPSDGARNAGRDGLRNWGQSQPTSGYRGTAMNDLEQSVIWWFPAWF